ncbi:MAG: Holliday junction branch migration DNA helicase RuvB [Proteobacteria bacterium]|nr:Holliday junction branch migration DNA helicase RuvB [Pseudomonadota bacterium]
MRDELVLPEKTVDDIELDKTLRPSSLDDFIGQPKIIENLRIFIKAAKERDEAIDHILLYGPPGLGKTSLSVVIAREMGVNIRITSGPVIEKAGDLASILSSLSDKDVLFIDEIHRLPSVVEEVLYPAMEDFKIDIKIGQGPSARSLRISLPHFTLIGATTRAGLLASPLRDRFGFTARLDFYENYDLVKIVKRSAKILNIDVDESGAHEIARRSRGTPRIANRILKRLRDYAQVLGSGKIDIEIAKKGLSALDIDEEGFDTMDREILSAIINKFNGGPVGIDTLSVAVNEERETIEDVYEPYLIQKGFISRTPRGRVATPLAYKYLKIENKNSRNRLFDD